MVVAAAPSPLGSPPLPTPSALTSTIGLGALPQPAHEACRELGILASPDPHQIARIQPPIKASTPLPSPAPPALETSRKNSLSQSAQVAITASALKTQQDAIFDPAIPSSSARSALGEPPPSLTPGHCALKIATPTSPKPVASASTSSMSGGLNLVGLPHGSAG